MTENPPSKAPDDSESAQGLAEMAHVRHLEETMRRAGLTPSPVFGEPEAKPPEPVSPSPE